MMTADRLAMHMHIHTHHAVTTAHMQLHTDVGKEPWLPNQAT